MENSVSVQTLMQDIRDRIRRRRPPHATGMPAFAPAAHLPDITLLEAALRSVDSCKELVGELPAQPPSLRARVGYIFVKAVQRMLFWYTPQIRQFQLAAAEALARQLEAIKLLAAWNQENEKLLAEIRNGLDELTQAREADRARLDMLQQDLAAEIRARKQLAERLEAEFNTRRQVSSGLGDGN